MKKWYQGKRLEINKDKLKKHKARMSIYDEALERGFYTTLEKCGMGYMIKKDKNNT